MNGAPGGSQCVSKRSTLGQGREHYESPPTLPLLNGLRRLGGPCVCLRSVQSELHVNNSPGGWQRAHSSGRNMCGLHSCPTYIIIITTTCYEWREPLPCKAHACTSALGTHFCRPRLQKHLANPGEITEWRCFGKSQAFEIKSLVLEPKCSFLSPL